MLPRRLVALCLPAVFGLPATASAAPFKDRVISAGGARAAQASGPTQRYPTADGLTLRVTADDPAVAQRYATFVGTLPHGAELADLRIVVVPAADVARTCGGPEGEGILACYGGDDGTMVVPDGPVEGSSVSTEYVIAHEYGHHIAAHRSNAPLEALDYGPKRWSSYELVCTNASRGRLAPGDEGQAYLANPGEAWAEVYARLVFPNEAWRFTPLLRPTQGSLLAAMADIAQPWARRTSMTFSGTGTRSFKLPLTLDGAFTLTLDAPRNARHTIVLRSGGKLVERTARRRLHYGIACRDQRTETVTIKVSGRGKYSLEARYAG